MFICSTCKLTSSRPSWLADRPDVVAQVDGNSHARKLTQHPKFTFMPANCDSLLKLLDSLPVGLQLPQHVMDEFCNLILIERVAMHWLLPDRAIGQPFRRLLHEVK